jgi:tetratricopeptide (TPR) repeat protein
MFNKDQEQFLLRHLGRANLVLFLGAGFSSGATNRLGQAIPVGSELAKAIWRFLEYDGDYDDTPLDELYEAALLSGKPHPTIRNFLEQHLLTRQIPDFYELLPSAFWFRIYTTNVDDLVERVYVNTNGRLEILAFPQDDVTERDQSLAQIQLVHLNGRLPCSPNEITFSPRQYARAGIRPQPLYDLFVRDFATRPVIFIGTRLNEPLFWHALESRQERGPGIGEHRPQSFLIAPKISPAKRDQLARFNVVPIEDSAEMFLRWLDSVRPQLPTRLEALQRSAPDIATIIGVAMPNAVKERELRDFANSFGIVPGSPRTGSSRSVYLLGAAPRWEDLFDDRDAPRTLTPEIRALLDAEMAAEEPRLKIAAVLGSAGSGKSTILRRVGLQQSQAGRAVYVTNSESLPSPDVIRRVLDALPDRVILLFDNAEVVLPLLPEVVRELVRCSKPPVLLIASRTNDFDRLWGRFAQTNTEVIEFHVPHLKRAEIDSIISILDREGLLGELRGLTNAERVKVFEDRAQKQILVAMREATTSKGFDLIIRDEFDKLVPEETKALYLCVALATEAGYRLTREEFVACARVPAAEALHLLNRNLRDIVVGTGIDNNLLLLRHRLISEVVVEEMAPRPQLRDAYIRLLSALAPMVRGAHWRSRVARLARAILNHKAVYARFRSDIDEARSIFSALQDWFGSESQFWLQFGSLELEGRGGDLRLAENYLRQAESLDPHDVYTQNAIAHLLLRKGIEADSFDEALKLRAEATEILKPRIEATGLTDAYAVHILCSQRYNWARVWFYENDDEKRRELEWMRELLDQALTVNPRHQRLRHLREMLERAYLQLAIPRETRPEAPVLPADWS